MINVAWDHNSYYHERVLRALPARCGWVLDVGCGAGRFAARLAERADRVDALDRSPAMIAEARRIVPATVTCLLGDAAAADLPAGAYDAVTSISALHHMDLPAVLPRLAAALRPGRLLIAVRGSGDGGIYSTAADISALWQSLFTGRIVPARWVAEMVRPRSASRQSPSATVLAFGSDSTAIPSFWRDSTPVFHSGACTIHDRPLPAP
ncbi:MAG TPA: class I SAM-dependent methyltransferase [Streptosporangiaceae bacterium]